MNRITITVGVGADWQGNPLPHDDVVEGLRKVREELTKRYTGYTEDIVHGGWRKNGHTFEEPARSFLIVSDVAESDAMDLARMIGRMFKQQAVMLEIEPLSDGSGVLPVW